MSLEACMIIVDNSEWTRNGDFSPNRFQAQMDAVTVIAGSKTGQNAENGVGIIDITGPRCHVSLATDRELSKLLTCLHKIKIQGKTKFSAAIQVAQLALKHRQNKSQKPRILAFVASPITESENDLVRLGRQMKKNNVAIDVVSFGEVDENESKLKAFIEAVNRDDNSHYVAVPSGTNVILSDVLMGTPILSGSISSGDNFDASIDPELAHAIELSLREAERKAQEVSEAEMEVEDVMAVEGQDENEDEDEEGSLAQAIAMSYQNQPMDMDEELQLAIQQSLAESQQQHQEHKESQEQTEEDVSPEDLKNIFQSLPGVDLNDPNIQEILKKKKEDQEKK